MEQKKRLKNWLKKYDQAIDKTINEMAYDDHISPVAFFEEIDKLYARKKHFMSIIKQLC